MKKWLVLLLIAALCVAPLSGALASEVDDTAVPEEIDLTIGGESGSDAPDETSPEDANAPVPDEAYTQGYGVVIAETANVYADAAGAQLLTALKKGDVVLATALDKDQNRLCVAFDTEARGVVTGYIDAADLEKLSGAAYDEALNAIAQDVRAFYGEGIDYPLATLACVFEEETSEEQTEVVSEDTEQTEVASDNAEQTEVVNEPAPAVEPVPERQSVPTPVEQNAPVQQAAPAPVEQPAPVQQAAPAPVEQSTPVQQAAPAPVEQTAQPVEQSALPETVDLPAPVEYGEDYAVAASEDPVPITDFSIPATLTLGLKESYKQLTPVLVPTNSDSTFTWRSSKPKVVYVNDFTGELIAKKKGTAVITATSDNGIARTCTVTVVAAPKTIALNESKVVLMGGGQSFQLVPTLTKKSGGTVYYASSNPEVVSVSAGGLLVSGTPGGATVTATTYNNKSASCTVLVLDPNVPQPASVVLPAAEYTIGLKQTLSFAPTMIANDGSSLGTTEFSVVSSVPKKLKVNPDTKSVVGVKKGNYTVRVEAYNGVFATATVHVVKAPSKVTLAPKNPVVGVGQTRQLAVTLSKGSAGTVSFTSNNTGIATVDANGYVTGVSVGSTVITARTHNGKTAKVTVKVTKGPEYVALNADYNLEYDKLNSTYSAVYTKTMNPGESFQLACEVEYGANGDVAAFESRNPAVATVSASGLITAVAPGEAVIVVRATGGAETYCRVTVTGGAAAVLWYDAAEANLTVGQSMQVPALASSTLTAAELANATYASGNTGVFTVAKDEKGVWSITGVATGAATMTATVGANTAALNVTVLPAVPTATTPTYRLFAAYEYFNPDVKGYIPFTENNAKSVASVFGNSSIAGLGYTTKVMGNPTKTALLSGISSFFSGTTDADVSIVYLCSHGHMTNGIAGYRMSLPGYDDSPTNANYYMSSQEIFNCVSRIRGSVVLIVDSCYSGAFLEDMSGQLAAQGGRIAVMTAASDTRATYYNVKKVEKSVDFFTFFLLKGLGYNHRDKWWNSNAAGKRGAYPGFLAADATGNGDGIVTLGEFYNYGANSIAANIPSYMKKSWYWGDKTRVQTPRFYAGSLADLVIYQPR